MVQEEGEKDRLYEYALSQAEKDLEHGMTIEKENAIAREVKANVINFYNENKDICKRALEYSNEFYGGMPIFINEPAKTTQEAFKDIIGNRKTILVITANPIEMAVFLHRIYDKFGKTIDSYLVDSNTYNVAEVNANQLIVHHHIGDTGDSCVQIALDTTIRIFQPDYVILLGICYGINMKKQKLGNVMTSSKVIGFRINFQEDRKGNTYNEVQDEVMGMPQRSFSRKIKQKMTFSQITSILSSEDKPTIAKHEHGAFLSCNSLMSSYRVKEDILTQFKPRKIKPIAGEMEGGGLLRSILVAEDGFGNWLIIKSICDWGMVKNELSDDEEVSEEIKDSIQAVAMSNSCATFEKLLDLFD